MILESVEKVLLVYSCKFVSLHSLRNEVIIADFEHYEKMPIIEKLFIRLRRTSITRERKVETLLFISVLIDGFIFILFLVSTTSK